MIKRRSYCEVGCRPGTGGYEVRVEVSSVDLGSGFNTSLVLSDIGREQENNDPVCIQIESREHAQAIVNVLKAWIDD